MKNQEQFFVDIEGHIIEYFAPKKCDKNCGEGEKCACKEEMRLVSEKDISLINVWN